MTLKWEKLDGELGEGKLTFGTFRTPVPGGWLVVVATGTTKEGHMNSFFYPDMGHRWFGDTTIDEQAEDWNQPEKYEGFAGFLENPV